MYLASPSVFKLSSESCQTSIAYTPGLLQKRPLTLHGVLADPSDSRCLQRLSFRSTTRTRKLNVQPLPGHPPLDIAGDGGCSSEQRAALQRSGPRYGFSARL